MIGLNTTHNILHINDRNREVQYPLFSAHCLTITVLCAHQFSITQGGPTGTNSFTIFPLQQKISIVPVHYLKWTKDEVYSTQPAALQELQQENERSCKAI